MKQISFALNLLLLTAVIYFSCNNSSSSLPIASTGTGTPDCLTCDRDFDGVLAKDFIRVVARYRKTHWDVINRIANLPGVASGVNPNTADINGNPTFQDSRCVWFSLDTIKKFMCYMERYSDSVGIPSDSLGIRFYYAVYPDTATSDFPESEYGTRFGQHTLYMVPTRQVQGEGIDFDPRISYENKNKNHLPNDSAIVYLAQLLGNPSNLNKELLVFPGAHASRTATTLTQAYFWNNGKLCPTNCPAEVYNTLKTVDDQYPQGLDYKQN